MLGVVYEFIYEYIWYPLFDTPGYMPMYTIGGQNLELPEILTFLTCILFGCLLLGFIYKIIKWVIRSFSGLGA